MNDQGPRERALRERDLYLEAVALGNSAAREAFLRQACAGDPELRAAVEELLAREARAESFFSERMADNCERVADNCLTLPESWGESRVEGPGSVIGPYKLLQEIGEGGFGIVYLAEQRSPVFRKVALKVLKPGMDTRQVIARFEAERQALALMEHPNIAKVFDAGAVPESHNRPFFVMELVRGVKITEFCDENRLTMEERLRLFVDVCLAVQHAHQKGIIHRDIKPSNILVTLHDGKPVPKVIDFGIAKATQQRLTERTLFTRFEQFVGTPAYISPEQATMDGLDVDTRSDIYSLGVVLCELLTGRTPFDPGELARSGYDEIRRRIREEEPPSPSRLVRAMPVPEQTRTAERRSCDLRRFRSRLTGELDWIVMKAIDKDRTRRYESAAALAADIRRFLNDEPVLAAAPSARYRLRKFARRHRSAILGAAALVGILAAGAVVSTWQAVRAVRAEAAEKKERLAAEQQRDIANRERIAAENSRSLYRRLFYVSNMNLLSQDIELGNTPRVMEILKETSDHEDRGFEWFHWHGAAHRSARILAGHPGGVRALAFSGDGRRLVSGGEDHAARVWEVDSGREIAAFALHHGPVHVLAVPANGAWVVSGGEDRTIRIWDLLSGEASGELPGWDGIVMALAMTPDGRTAAALDQDGTLIAWDLPSRGIVLARERVSMGTCLALSADGSRLLVSDVDGEGVVIDVRTALPECRLEGHRGSLRAAAFDRSGLKVVTGAADGTARVWDARTGALLQVLAGHRASVGAVAFSPDGRLVLTGGDDLAVMLWDAGTGDVVATLLGHRAPVAAVAFSPDGMLVASGGGDGMVRLWSLPDVASGEILRGPNVTMSVAISPDGRQVAATFQGIDAADSPRVWALDGSGEPEFLLEGHGDWVSDVAFSNDGALIATACFDQSARLWDARTGALVRRLTTDRGRLTSVDFSPDGRWLVAGSYGGVEAWDLAAAWDREQPAAAFSNLQVEAVDVSSDGRWLASGHEDGSVSVWAVGTWDPVWSARGHPRMVTAVAFSPDCRLLASGGSDRVVQVWDVESGERAFSLRGHQGAVTSVAFATDGRRILTGSRDGTAKLWDPETQRETLNLGPHQGEVNGVAMSRDGSVIATAGWRWRDVRIWEAPTEEAARRRDEAESLAERRLAERQAEVDARLERDASERESGTGVVTRWLVLAPVPADSFAHGFDGGALAAAAVGRAEAGPREGDRLTLADGSEIAWRAAAPLADGVLDVHDVVGSSVQDCAGIAVSYLVIDRDVEGVRMRVGGDDVGRIFINGEEVHSWGWRRSFQPDQDLVEGLSLRQGVNLLTYQIYNGPGDWKLSVRFTDADGRPLTGLVSTLSPDQPD